MWNLFFGICLCICHRTKQKRAYNFLCRAIADKTRPKLNSVRPKKNHYFWNFILSKGLWSFRFRFRGSHLSGLMKRRDIDYSCAKERVFSACLGEYSEFRLHTEIDCCFGNSPPFGRLGKIIHFEMQHLTLSGTLRTKTTIQLGTLLLHTSPFQLSDYKHSSKREERV